VQSIGDSFTIIKNDGADAVGGTFLNRPEGSSFANNSALFSISYRGGDGNDVVLYRGFPPLRLTAIGASSNATQIQGLGSANLGYTIEAAVYLNPVIQWSNLGTALANGNGVFVFNRYQRALVSAAILSRPVALIRIRLGCVAIGIRRYQPA
jgi:hypothetical protein